MNEPLTGVLQLSALIQPGELRAALVEVNAESFEAFPHLVPPSAAALSDVLGAARACRLINALAGAQLLLPSAFKDAGPGGRRCRLLAEVLGSDDAAAHLVAELGGSMLEVPICLSLRIEQRKQWAKEMFDELTGPRFRQTSTEAVSELCAVFAAAGVPVSYRSVEGWLSVAVSSRRVGGHARPGCRGRLRTLDTAGSA